MTDALEFSRLFDIHDVPPDGKTETLEATADERAAVAARFGVEAVGSLSATMSVQPWKRNGFRVRGTATAEVTQVCVVTLEPFEQAVSADLDQVFVEGSSKLAAGDKEIVVSVDDEDIGYIDDGQIELGEFAVEALCLELDPYPRKPGAEFQGSSTEAGGGKTARDNPFAVLQQLKQENDE